MTIYNNSDTLHDFLFYEIATVQISTRTIVITIQRNAKRFENQRTWSFELSNNEVQWQKWTEIRETSTRRDEFRAVNLSSKNDSWPGDCSVIKRRIGRSAEIKKFFREIILNLEGEKERERERKRQKGQRTLARVTNVTSVADARTTLTDESIKICNLLYTEMFNIDSTCVCVCVLHSMDAIRKCSCPNVNYARIPNRWKDLEVVNRFSVCSLFVRLFSAVLFLYKYFRSNTSNVFEYYETSYIWKLRVTGGEN